VTTTRSVSGAQHGHVTPTTQRARGNAPVRALSNLLDAFVRSDGSHTPHLGPSRRATVARAPSFRRAKARTTSVAWCVLRACVARPCRCAPRNGARAAALVPAVLSLRLAARTRGWFVSRAMSCCGGCHRGCPLSPAVVSQSGEADAVAVQECTHIARAANTDAIRRHLLKNYPQLVSCALRRSPGSRSPMSCSLLLGRSAVARRGHKADLSVFQVWQPPGCLALPPCTCNDRPAAVGLMRL
jgi:hypothetical protein